MTKVRERSRGAPRAGALALLALLLVPALFAPVPVALAHGGGEPHDHPEDEPNATEKRKQFEEAKRRALRAYVNQSPWLSLHAESWWWGKVAAVPVPAPASVILDREVRLAHPWAVWLATRPGTRAVDVYAHNVEAGTGLFVTNVSSAKRDLDFDGKTAVWVDHRDRRRGDIWALDFDTNGLVRVSNGSLDELTPAVAGGVVAWQDNNNKLTWDIHARRLDGSPAIVAASGPSRQTDPVVAGGVVVWRASQYGVWELAWFDVATGRTGIITRGPTAPSVPVSDGKSIHYLEQRDGAWRLLRFDPASKTVRDMQIAFKSSHPPAIAGDLAVWKEDDGKDNLIFAANLSNGQRVQLTGTLKIHAGPYTDGERVYAVLANGTGLDLVTFRPSPHALVRAPRLLIVDPPVTANVILTRNDVVVRGSFSPGEWGPPVSLAWTTDGIRYTEIPPASEFTVTLKPGDFRPGPHVLQVRAIYAVGAPLYARLSFGMAPPVQGLDLERVSFAYARATLAFFIDNPGFIALVAVVLLIVALLFARAWVRGRLPLERLRALARRRWKVKVELVRPEVELEPVAPDRGRP